MRPVRIGVLNGESGPATVQEALRRICEEKEVSLGAILHNLFWGFELPRLDDDMDLILFSEQIVAQRLEVVIIDPLYLCLLGSGGGQNAANLFDVGPLLSAVTRACLNAGATPILVHHATKAAGQIHRPPDLDNLAFAGIQEFARQWILLSRRETYAPGNGLHRL